jgi:PAS domain S-box-containing protein
MMAAFSDISDRKRAADALQRSHDDLERRIQERTAALRDAHHEIASLLEEIGDAFFALGRDWRFRYLNSRAEQFFKGDAPALIGKGLWDVQPELAGTIYQEEFERSFRDRAPVSFEAQFPGRPIWVEVRAFAAPDGLSVFLHEISEQKEMERHLQVTADLLKLYTLARSREEYLEAAVNILKGWAFLSLPARATPPGSCPRSTSCPCTTTTASARGSCSEGRRRRTGRP